MRKEQNTKRKIKEKMVKLSLLGFFLLFIVGGYFSGIFGNILGTSADTLTSVMKATDIDFAQGTLTDVEVDGSGNGAVVQLEGDGGADWLDPNWLFRRPVTVTNSGSAQTDYQTLLSISYDSDMQADFDDLRFANASGTELDYWLQSKTDSDSAEVWVEADSLNGSGDTTIYVYYGNGSAGSASDGEATFDFFDDFDDGTIDTDKWTEVDPSSRIGETGGELVFDSLGGMLGWDNTVYTDDAFSRSNISFEMDYEWTSDNGSYDALMMGWHDNTSGISYTNLVYGYYNNGVGGASTIAQTGYEDGSSRGTFSGHDWSQNTDYDVRIRTRTSGGAYYEYSTDSGENWTTAYTSAYSTESNVHPGWAFYSGRHEFDNARVRKWMNNEPSIAVGSEQSALAPTGTYESPVDSNVIDIIWNGSWGDGTNGSTAFEATTYNVGANATITFQIRAADTPANLSSASYSIVGIANSGTTLIRTKAQMDALGLPSGGAGRYLQLRATLSSADGITNPQLDDYTIFYMADDTAPAANASSIEMRRQIGGDVVSSGDWANNEAPYFSWIAGTDTQAGIKGYCLYLGTDTNGNPETAKGLLGTSPVDTTGTTCQFIVDAISIDFANTVFRGDPWLTSSTSNYYLNIKVIDNANNVFGGSSEQFTFRFDNTIPKNPDYISLPGGWISTRDANITWPSAGASGPNDDHSGLAGLQYRISEAGTWYGELHNGAEDLTDLLTNDGSYTTQDPPDYDDLLEGSNLFYIRSWDVAGNVSSSYVTGALKINTAAPSVPRNLQVTPEQNTENAFSFSWDAPESFTGQEENITYCFTFNTLPTDVTCQYTDAGVTVLSEDAYATQPGENTIYVVAKDEADNINYDIYTTKLFEANTSAPGIPLGLDIADISVKATSSWKLALSWEAPESLGAGVENYKVYHSTDGVTYTLESTATDISYVDINLDQRTHYYKIRACDSANNCGAFSSEVSLFPDGKFTDSANLTGEPKVINITTKRATITWSTNRDSDSRVSYGKSSKDYYDEEPSKSEQTTDHEISLTSLDPGQKYYYKAIWVDEDGNVGKSEEKSFSTDDAPSVKEVKEVNVGIGNATIEFTTKGATKAKVYYGKSTDYGGSKEISTSTDEATYSVQLIGLEDGAKYYYQINTFDQEEDEYDGTILDFTTLPRPRISDVRVQQVVGTAQPTILTTWTTNTEVSSIVTYYPEGKAEEAKDEVNVELGSDLHRMLIRSLVPQTNYVLIVKGRDKAGNEAASDTHRFTTETDTRPPLISELIVEGTNASLTSGNSPENLAQLIVSWDTDEPATSQVEFGEGTGTSYSQKTQQDSNLTVNHLVVISGLTPSKVYHLRALSEDGAGNITNSIDTVTIAPKATDSALSLVITNLREAFGFLGGAL